MERRKTFAAALLAALAAVGAIGCSEVDRLRIRAHLGGADSQLLLGHAYDKGLGVVEDDTEAVRWYTKAADQGHPKAPRLLAEKYALGEGVDQDVVQAHMWFALAAETGKGVDGREISKIEALMTPEQIAESKRRSDAWRAAH